MLSLTIARYGNQRSIRAFRPKPLTSPIGPTGFHEIKHDGYRLIVQRDGKRGAAVPPQRPRLERSISADHPGRVAAAN
jgi:hypothetical protein